MAGMRARPPTGGAGSSTSGPEMTHREAAEYIAAMLEGLQQVAKGAEMTFLAYLIEMALEEAKSQRFARD